ncbi:ABC transporter ATP-binding protein [Leifsonia kafniensis]|uniref:ABC transporter ATP-binding protein n=1 Tax=Leifsonia kafniensis TaxID=475957 RepID=A0ABP7KUF4_9MICO
MSIQLDNIGMRFGTGSSAVWAVKDASLTIEKNQFVSIVGTSGCGKSTLLSIVGGLVLPTEGTASVDGVPIAKPGLDRGMVFQNYSLFPWLTAQQNIEFVLKETGTSRAAERSDRAREMLTAVGLADFADKYPSELSGGMRQRVAIARSLSYRPSILLMDEPFGALDALTRGLMQELLVKIWEQSDLTVLFITHDIAEAVFLSDRVLVMTNRPGKIKADIAIDLPRPRTEDLIRSPEFGALELHVLDQIKAESRAAEHLTLPVDSAPAAFA